MITSYIKYNIKRHDVVPNLQHEVFPQNVPHTMQSRCNSISIPWFHKKKTISIMYQIISSNTSSRTKISISCLVRHTFLAPIQKLYQSLGPLSSSKKYSSMWGQSLRSNPERKKKMREKSISRYPLVVSKLSVSKGASQLGQLGRLRQQQKK